MNLRHTLRKLRRSFDSQKPLVEVGISRANLLHNLALYRSIYPTLTFAPVLKSNAYGHGLVLIAELLDKEPIAFFMVDSLFEARTLRHAGIRSRVVIMGYVRPVEIARNRLPEIDFAIVDIEQLREVAHAVTRPTRLHLKIDTGMHRHGILPKDLSEALSLAKSNAHLSVVGACSHFADAENQDQTFTDKQVAVWNAARATIKNVFPLIEYFHFAATKGIARYQEIGVNVIRLGMGLYDVDTSREANMALLPVLEMRSVVSSIREVPQGECVGYNAMFTATKPSRIATVPVGYFEGLDRELSNVGSVQIAGTTCRLVGRISMNMSSVDVTDIPGIQRGDVVTIISRNHADPNSILSMATLAHTTPYVLLAHIPQHLKRVVE